MISELPRETIDRLGEKIDRLVTTDVRNRGMIDTLYPAARKLYDRPLVSFAAEKLAEVMGEGDCVFIVTGMASYGLRTETDGPIGSAALARALRIGLGVKPVFITHESFTEILTATAIGGGFAVFPAKDIQRAWSKLQAALVVGFPVDDAKAKGLARSLIREYNPKAVIAIEAKGANKEGVYHVWDGTSVTEYEAKMVHLFEEARKKNILTAGIFDGCGTEIGFGTISDVIIRTVPRFASCKCGCEEGMHDATQVDIVVPASVSNWGAYGIEACLSGLLRRKDVFHNGEIESQMLRRCVDAGAIEGSTGFSEFSVDGLPEKIHLSLIEIMSEVVQDSFEEFKAL